MKNTSVLTFQTISEFSGNLRVLCQIFTVLKPNLESSETTKFYRTTQLADPEELLAAGTASMKSAD